MDQQAEKDRQSNRIRQKNKRLDSKVEPNDSSEISDRRCKTQDILLTKQYFFISRGLLDSYKMKKNLLNDTKLSKTYAIYVKLSTIVHLNRSFHSLISTWRHSFFTRRYVHHITLTTWYYTFRQFRFLSILLPNSFYYVCFKSTVHSSVTSIPVSHHLHYVHSFHKTRFRMAKTLCKKRES